MNLLRDRFLATSSFLSQAPDTPSGAGGASSSTPTSPPPSSSPSPSSAPAAAPASPSPSPSSPPTPAPATSPVAPEAPDSGIDFDLFFGDGDPEPKDAPLAPPAPATPKAPETPSAPPAVESPKPTTVAPAPTEAPAAAPSPSGDATAASTTTPALDPTDPASLARHLVENEATMIEHVAKSMFTISDKEMEELETNVGEAIPKLLGKTFVKMQANMLQQIARLVPMMVQRTTEAVQRGAEAEAKFFKAWPALKADNAEHLKVVRQYAVTYRQMHPQATFEQMVQDLGPLVMMAAKVNPTVGAPAAPAAAPPKTQPFVPSTPGATVVSATPVDEDSAIAVLDPNREF